MRRRQPLKSSTAFCVKSASCPPTELLLSPGLVFPVLGQVFGECGRKSTWRARRGLLTAAETSGQAGKGTARQLKSHSATKASGGRGTGGFSVGAIAWL